MRILKESSFTMLSMPKSRETVERLYGFVAGSKAPRKDKKSQNAERNNASTGQRSD